jgi:hypothetical protein
VATRSFSAQKGKINQNEQKYAKRTQTNPNFTRHFFGGLVHLKRIVRQFYPPLRLAGLPKESLQQRLVNFVVSKFGSNIIDGGCSIKARNYF